MAELVAGTRRGGRARSSAPRTTPSRTTASSSSARTASSWPTPRRPPSRPRWTSRRRPRPDGGEPRRHRRTGSSGRGALRRVAARALPGRPHRHGDRRSTAPTARPPSPRPRCWCASGATVRSIGIEPDGVNINDGCGSTDLGAALGGRPRGRRRPGPGLRRRRRPRAGGGRAPARPVDGDQILALCALGKRAGAASWPGDAVVTTTMTNLGFRRAMAAEGIEVRWTDVGDRYVLEEMRGNGFVLGGEQSGHLIDLLARALRRRPRGGAPPAARAARARARTWPTAAAIVQRLPQRLVNVTRRRARPTSRTPPGVWEAVRRVRGRARRGRPRRRPGVGDRAPRAGDGRGADRPRIATGGVERLAEVGAGARRAATLSRCAAHHGGPRGAADMCGIIGYVGGRPCRELILTGLERLEYRGYDSAGLRAARRSRRASSSRSARWATSSQLRDAAGLNDGLVGDGRPGPHPLGHPRPRHHRQRPPARQRRRLGRWW